MRCTGPAQVSREGVRSACSGVLPHAGLPKALVAYSPTTKPLARAESPRKLALVELAPGEVVEEVTAHVVRVVSAATQPEVAVLSRPSPAAFNEPGTHGRAI
jgi:hypothetical protein